MLKTVTSAVVVSLALAGPIAAQSTRSSDAHVHGSGAVSIAIDGSVLSLMIETPAYDVLGFEHGARSTEDRRLVSAVRSLLENPQALFDLPVSAGCSPRGVDVAIGAENDGAQDLGDGGNTHSEIAGQYIYECTNVSDVDRIGFPWFEAFPLSLKLDVVVLSARGQFAGAVTPDRPDFRLQ